MTHPAPAEDHDPLDVGSATVEVRVVDGVATITLNRPPVNALNQELQRTLLRASEVLAARTDVAAVVLTGSARAFAAGVDIAELQQMGYADMAAWGVTLHRAFDAVAQLPYPVVAAVRGYALGGGCELALCADIRIAATNAVFGQPEVKLGLIPGAGGSQRLPRLVGPARAKEMIFTGRNVKADEALRFGLVDQVVEPEALQATALAWARQFVGGPALALRAAKDAVDRGLDSALSAGLALERAHFAAMFDTADGKAGLASFLEHGPGKAHFTGR